MLIKVEWPDAYTTSAKDKWELLDWSEVQKWHPLAPETKPDNPYFYAGSMEAPTRLTEEEIINLQALGFKMTVVPYPGAMVTKMQDRHAWEHSQDVHPLDLMKGNAVQITIADMALLLINEVEVCEDFCTVQLQEMLDQGWRILAVCPPNAQRRPDYILGRVRPKDPK